MAVPRTTIYWTLSNTSRLEIRAAVLQKWAQEAAGISKEEPQRFKYVVEAIGSDGCIFLTRPAWKNKGCDFVVHTDPRFPTPEGGTRSNPRHDDLVKELRAIRQANVGRRRALDRAVERVWNCDQVEKVCKDLIPHLRREWQIRAEFALKVAKWLFIEQDITDWNTSGRTMLMNAIRKGLC